MCTASDRRGYLAGAFRTADFVVVHLLAAILAIAAVAKAASDRNPTLGWVPLELIVGLEMAGAFLLVFRRDRRFTRLAVGGLFVVLAAFSLSATIQGRPSCDCLGDVAAPPLWLFLLDAGAAGWLLAGVFVTLGRRSPLHELDRESTCKPRQLFDIWSREACAFAVIGASAICVASASWLIHRDDPSRALHIDPRELSLGTIWLQERAVHQFTIKNRSANELNVVLNAGCVCTRLEPSSFRLEAGQSRAVTADIDLFKIARDNWKGDHWRIDVPVTAQRLESGAITARWSVTGVIVSPFQRLPQEIPRLRLSRMGAPLTLSCDLATKPGIDLSGVECDHASLSCRIIDEGHSRMSTIAIRLEPQKCETGSLLSRVQLQLRSRGDALPPFALLIPLTVASSVNLDPPVLLMNQATASRVWLTSEDDRRFRIVRVVPGDGVIIDNAPSELAYDTMCAISLRPTAPDDSLSFTHVFIDVQKDGVSSVERLTLRVQRPTSAQFASIRLQVE